MGGRYLPGNDEMMQNIDGHKRRRTIGRESVIGGLIAAHGVMHAVLLSTPRPDGGAGNFVTRGGEVPLLSSLGLGGAGVEALGSALMLITAAGLLLSAFMYLRQVRGWERCLMASSTLSVVSLLLFWNSWMIMGPVISVGLMALALRSTMTTEVRA
ncbi:MAG: hypothetical protein ISF22_01805 [Methanomassiliicoccus sp.]|nr:hypothetical protein [Methanomassiliicoccus sp.]